MKRAFWIHASSSRIVNIEKGYDHYYFLSHHWKDIFMLSSKPSDYFEAYIKGWVRVGLDGEELTLSGQTQKNIHDAVHTIEMKSLFELSWVKKMYVEFFKPSFGYYEFKKPNEIFSFLYDKKISRNENRVLFSRLLKEVSYPKYD